MQYLTSHPLVFNQYTAVASVLYKGALYLAQAQQTINPVLKSLLEIMMLCEHPVDAVFNITSTCTQSIHSCSLSAVQGCTLPFTSTTN